MAIQVELPLACTLVVASAEPPYLGHGTVVAREGDHLDITVSRPSAALRPGASVVLEFGSNAETRRAIAQITAVDGARVGVDVRRMAPPDKRDYPRVEGPVELRYHVGGGPEAESRWLAGGEAAAPTHRPDPFMNFSVTGLMFEDEPRCAEGDTLLVAFAVPGEPGEHRASTRVVRVQPIPVDERDESVPATHRIAIHFEHLPEAGADALARHTARIQEALLGRRLRKGDG